MLGESIRSYVNPSIIISGTSLQLCQLSLSHSTCAELRSTTPEWTFTPSQKKWPLTRRLSANKTLSSEVESSESVKSRPPLIVAPDNIILSVEQKFFLRNRLA